MGDAEATDARRLVWLKAIGLWVLIAMVLVLAGFVMVAFWLVGSTVPTT